MRFNIFDPIVSVEEDMPLCNLGHLLNGYAARLSSLEVGVTPQETLREYQRLAITPLGQLPKADRDKARALRAAQERYYCLKVLNNSLHDMHLCVLGACNTLSDLFTRYDGDLHRYATQERLRQIAEYVPGTDEEMREDPEFYAEFIADWEPTEPGQPWRVKYKDDEQSLAPYTIKAQLSQYFASLHEHASIETIGSATPEDFAYFTQVVSTHSENHKTSHVGPILGVYRRNQDTGELEHQDYAQRVENEINDARSDARVADYFKQILRRMQYVDGLALLLTDTASCRELLTELVAIRDCSGLHEPATLS